MKTKEAAIREVMGRYDLGDVLKVESLTQGYANENLKVNTDRRSILYRICRQQPLPLLEYEVHLMEQLKAAHLKTAFPLPDKKGNYIQKAEADFVMIYEFTSGEEPELTSEVARQMGIEVGKLSKIPLTTSLEKKNAIHLDNCHHLVSAFDECKNPMPTVFDYFKEQTDYLAEKLDDTLPRGVVHGDLFPNNTIFRNGELKALIDFEEACSDQLMFDVGMTINGFCFIDNQLQSSLLASFLDGYNSQRKMTAAEWAALSIYMQWGSHGMLSWHLKNELINVPNQVQHDRVLELMSRTQWIRDNENEILKMV